MTDDALSEIDSFIPANTAEPHISRARAILRKHPEVRELVGPAPSTFLVLLALVAAQTSVALSLQHAPLWVLALVAYTVGAVLNCGVLNMVHEASHGLIFRGRRWNRMAAYVANLGTFWPSVETFFRYHLPHHRYLGEYDRDTTIARDWEARFVGRSALRKVLWLVFFAVIYPFRVTHMNVGRRYNGRIVFNFVMQAAWWVLLYSVGGWRPLAYLALSFYFHFGLHPLNAIALQEHLFVRHGQESYSYYGIANWITFNAGYHVEHHDMPSIPWSRLRRLRAIAPEFYEGRHAYHSWTGLILKFVRDRRWSLWARVMRPSNRVFAVSTKQTSEAHN
jgi:sphingolipid delta-4 desaturase